MIDFAITKHPTPFVRDFRMFSNQKTEGWQHVLTNKDFLVIGWF